MLLRCNAHIDYAKKKCIRCFREGMEASQSAGKTRNRWMDSRFHRRRRLLLGEYSEKHVDQIRLASFSRICHYARIKEPCITMSCANSFLGAGIYLRIGDMTITENHYCATVFGR